MSDDSGRTTVEARREIADRLLDEATTPRFEGGVPNVDPDDGEAVAFMERALEEIAEKLAQNHRDDVGRFDTTLEDYEAVESMLDDVGIEEVQLRRNGLHSPKVTVWLTGHPPAWANTATRREFNFSVEREHYNGSPTHAVLDVRPF